MALEGSRSAGRSPNRHLDHVRDLPSDARNVSQGWRRIPRPYPESDLELHESHRARPGRTGEGHERPDAGGYQGRDGSGHASRGPIARWLRPVARRRHDDVRLLDLLGLLYREGQPDGPPRRHRSTRAGHRAELGLGLAGEPADSLQSRQRQCRRQRLEPSQANHRMERHGVGSGSMCPTMDRPRSRPTGSVRSS